MKEITGVLSAEEFEKVAQTCSRWSARSLDVARALLVDGVKLSVVAAKQEMKPQQASVIRSRFQDRATLAGLKKVSASEFMANESPQTDAALAAFKTELLKLSRANYSTEQMLLYLAQNNFTTDAKTLTDFLNKVNKNANTRSRK